MILLMTGDILQDDAEVLVNPVNCIGRMGKGLALSFKEKYPQMYDEYQHQCKHGHLRVGSLSVYPFTDQERDRDRYIINLPTKNHWKDDSRLDYVRASLKALVRWVDEFQPGSVAVPALGTGCGNLPWDEVFAVMTEILDSVPWIDWHVYPPRG